MVKEYKPFTKATLGDALPLVRDRFGDSACSLAARVLDNPLNTNGRPSGCIGYRDDKPMCLQAEMRRRMYIGQKEVYGLVGGLTCKARKGCPLSLLLETIDRAVEMSGDVVMTFGNSCCTETAMINDIGGGMSGPESCTRYLWRAIRPLECAMYFIRRKLFKLDLPEWEDFSTLRSAKFAEQVGDLSIRRLMAIEPEFFDALMAEFVKTNEAIVCSRTAGEIDWIFGERLRDGRCVLLAAYRGNRPAGYIIIKSNQKAKRWMILDWFADRNNEKVLETLLSTTCVFLKKNTPAMMLEVRGFPTWIQPLLKQYLPHARQIGHNVFSWGSSNKKFRKAIMPIIDSRKSWFFGPYDGDECLS